VTLDRSNRRSQIKTIKRGIEWLKQGVPLCAFPEGTRSKTGRLMPFKRGAFKMASSAGADIVPLSIVGSEKVMPAGWVMPMRSSRSVPAKIIVHPPISSEGKDEKELSEEVRNERESGGVVLYSQAAHDAHHPRRTPTTTHDRTPPPPTTHATTTN
jgi:1-acyl-sn-glycerol-3-phosphate acyltransferase